MSRVLVVDTPHRPRDPVPPGQARRRLSLGQAALWRRFPFPLSLPRAVPDAPPHPVRRKLAPGSRTSGRALVPETAPAAPAAAGPPGPAGAAGAAPSTARVVWAGELTHRGGAVHAGWGTRRATRRSRRPRRTRSRRPRHTRSRPPRFAHRRRPAGWWPPALAHRSATTKTWVRRLCRWAHVTALAQELVTVDTQALVPPEIAAVE